MAGAIYKRLATAESKNLSELSVKELRRYMLDVFAVGRGPFDYLRISVAKTELQRRKGLYPVGKLK